MHDPWQGRLSEFLEGELDDTLANQVSEHLRDCSMCREELTLLRSVVNTAGNLGDIAPPVDLWPGIAERVNASPLPRTVPPSWSRWLPLAGALLLGISVGYGLAHWPPAPLSERFVLVLHQPLGERRWTDEAQAAHDRRYREWRDDLASRGHVESDAALLSGQGYHLNGFEPRPHPLPTDFCEVTAVVVLRAGDYEHALELTQDCPHFEIGWLTLRRVGGG